MLNKVILIGRLTADPELRYTGNGTPVAGFTLAVDRSFTNNKGEKETDFIQIVVWNKQGESCAQHLGKGRLVAVTGRLQIRSYDDNQGIRRKAAEVVANEVKFLDWPKDRQQNQGAHDNAGYGNGYQQPPQGGYGQGPGSQPQDAQWSNNAGAQFGSEISFNEEEIPF